MTKQQNETEDPVGTEDQRIDETPSGEPTSAPATKVRCPRCGAITSVTPSGNYRKHYSTGAKVCSSVGEPVV